ncbi:MAG TPA: hypothetical protein VFT69_10060 [Pseudolabrys sp.]|nr:hypothetical protein [Pseudolabrys sp.]
MTELKRPCSFYARFSGGLARRSLTFVGMLLLLCGCSQYLDRRDAVSLNTGDALAADKVTMMVDPWPRWAAERNIAFNGARMQSAVERYRNNRVIPPHAAGTSAAYGAPSQDSSADNSRPDAPVGPTITQQSP